MERHKTTQSHANGTTMGRFPRLTPVRLSPQVPGHMTVSLYVVCQCRFGLRSSAGFGGPKDRKWPQHKLQVRAALTEVFMKS